VAATRDWGTGKGCCAMAPRWLTSTLMSALLSPFEETRFTIGFCSACERQVLTHPDLDSAEQRLLCVHCDAVVRDGLRAAAGSELPDHGYGLLELQGCGNPDCGGGACSRRQDGDGAE
jgi:hypothetical protein